MGKKKKTPAINSSSTADIAFLLLCYFLMTTTMGSQTGLQRRLPPMPDKDQKAVDQKVNRRNIVMVKINSKDMIFAGNKPVRIENIKEDIKVFLTSDGTNPDLPDAKQIDTVDVNGRRIKDHISKGVISLQNDRGTSYQTYIAVQNELVKAVNELRDEKSMLYYGKKFINLSEEEQGIIKKIIPQNISEAEPKDVTKK